MYDWPETRDALDVLWESVRRQLADKKVFAPDHLMHVEEQMPLWMSPDLLLGQTCGWPYANRLRGKVVPFARFDYGLEHCPAGMYQSVYIGKSEADRRFVENGHGLSQAKTIAINGDDSQSGFHVFAEISGKPASESILLERRIVSGAHRNSIRLVADGTAQIAAIDAVAFELARRHDPQTVTEVHVVGRSKPKPGLPLITSLLNSSKTTVLYEAVHQAVTGLDADTSEALMIKGVLPATDEDYSVFSCGIR